MMVEKTNFVSKILDRKAVLPFTATGESWKNQKDIKCAENKPVSWCRWFLSFTPSLFKDFLCKNVIQQEQMEDMRLVDYLQCVPEGNDPRLCPVKMAQLHIMQNQAVLDNNDYLDSQSLDSNDPLHQYKYHLSDLHINSSEAALSFSAKLVNLNGSFVSTGLDDVVMGAHSTEFSLTGTGGENTRLSYKSFKELTCTENERGEHNQCDRAMRGVQRATCEGNLSDYINPNHYTLIAPMPVKFDPENNKIKGEFECLVYKVPKHIPPSE